MNRDALEAAIAMEEAAIASLLDQVTKKKIRVSHLITELYKIGPRHRFAASIDAWIEKQTIRNQHGNLRRVGG